MRADLLKESELREQSREFLKNFIDAAQAGTEDVNAPSWKPAKEVLSSISRSRATQGFSPSETAMFVFSLKQPLFEVLKRESLPAQELADGSWQTTVLLDKLGLYTMEVFQQSREAIIGRQQEELLELSTPVVRLWDSILALPLIGTLNSERTQVVMESLLEKIVETEAQIAIIDITGVPTVDTLVAQHLLKTVAAARLDGRRLHHQRDPAADRPDDHSPRHQFVRRHHQGDSGGRLRRRVAPHGRDAQPRICLHLEESIMERIPILKMGSFLLVTIQVDMHDELAMTLQEDLTNRVVKDRARGVLIDISSLEVVDSFIGRMIANIAGMARMLDAETVLVGMRPAVAITLVELGMSLPGVRTALNVNRGMAILQTALGKKGYLGGSA